MSSDGIPCLYTKHKTQKAKTYHDGKLVKLSTKLMLYDEDGKSLDSKPYLPHEWNAQFPNFEFPKFLVEIEACVMASSTSTLNTPGAAAIAPSPPSSFVSGRTPAPPGGAAKFQPPRGGFRPPKRKMDEAEVAPTATPSAEANAFTAAFSRSKQNALARPSGSTPALGGGRRHLVPAAQPSNEPPTKKQHTNMPAESQGSAAPRQPSHRPTPTAPPARPAPVPTVPIAPRVEKTTLYVGKEWSILPAPQNRSVQEIIAFLPK
ncbi:hypothetical protein SDRG_09271 [Saprolegnia diclina VS20]|uniref:5'-3' DNA helicase ZGRF1-like N-terminal domain-containing protein n=1 Tax=Saprolegnia diclina (strain VS20) TaxID=1156394 RepID=T0QHV1_SAPDV|nr:hypothetical protein SDRG_09271 [Saprolegnia diclina VS20]EQC33290.1 hypothetical protein SDRG_09271 [Saprolegnia diclina VS20]|eukprot:XP_008613413.1 hypothetical protein SDRG_09271 [Saprolegnia diclina VS20]